SPPSVIRGEISRRLRTCAPFKSRLRGGTLGGGRLASSALSSLSAQDAPSPPFAGSIALTVVVVALHWKLAPASQLRPRLVPLRSSTPGACHGRQETCQETRRH